MFYFGPDGKDIFILPVPVEKANLDVDDILHVVECEGRSPCVRNSWIYS